MTTDSIKVVTVIRIFDIYYDKGVIMAVLALILALSLFQIPLVTSHIKNKLDPDVTIIFDSPKVPWYFVQHKVQAFSIAVNSLCTLLITIKHISND